METCAPTEHRDRDCVIRVAVPKARLWPASAGFLRQLGFPAHLDPRRFHYEAHTDVGSIAAVALKLPDIASVLADGLVDFAVLSDEWVAEAQLSAVPLVPLCWYHARICVLEPANAVMGARRTVATTFPHIARSWRGDFSVQVRPVSGSIEAFPGRLTDAAVDCVETGDTALRNGLIIGEELLRCDVRLMARHGVELTDAASRFIIAAAMRCSRDPGCEYGSSEYAVRSGRLA